MSGSGLIVAFELALARMGGVRNRHVLPISNAAAKTAVNGRWSKAGFERSLGAYWGAIIASSLIVVTTKTLAQAPQYTVHHIIEMPPGRTINYGAVGGINNFGQVTGATFSGDQFNNSTSAFLYSAGSVTGLGTLGGDSVRGFGINDLGQVTGASTISHRGPLHVFLYSGGVMTDLGAFGGDFAEGHDINNSGDVTGYYIDPKNGWQHRAFIYSAGTMINLGTLGGDRSEAYAINESGQTTGLADTSTSVHAFLYSDGTMIDLDTLGSKESAGLGINNAGQVTGYYAFSSGAYRAFLYSDGNMIGLGSFGGVSIGRDINNIGQVTGGSLTQTGQYRAFLYSGGVMIDLNTLIPPNSGWTLVDGCGINDLGQITGEGLYNGKRAVFLATPVDAISISLRSVTSAAVDNLTAGVDVPVEPVPSEDLLKAQPAIAKGLVSDGVTPLLIEIGDTTPPTQPTTYKITMTIDPVSGSITGTLNQRVKVLQFVGSQGSFIDGDTITLSPDHPTGFAYITGLKSEDIQVTPPSNELRVTLSATQTGSTTPEATREFRIRKPPIVLVHGYNSDKNAWYMEDGGPPEGFLASLNLSNPSDFILPIEYGVDRSTTEPDNMVNKYGPLYYLSMLLDQELTDKVESDSATLGWRQDWAFLRYDVVGHSQGGVLTRMLCASNPPVWSQIVPFRSDRNAYRGRFHRVISVGSPHNGTTQAHYFYRLALSGQIQSLLGSALIGTGFLQPKFDPFQAELQEVNGPLWRVDTAAKFHLLATTIDHGEPPPHLPDVFVDPTGPPALSYRASFFCTLVPGLNITRGKVVLPLGSDGVVDLASQRAGVSSVTPHTEIKGTSIAHSPPQRLFGVDPAATQTKNATIGARVSDLLRGPVSNFGPFELEPIPQTIKDQIEAVVPSRLDADVIRSATAGASRSIRSDTSAGSYAFTISTGAIGPPTTAPTWLTEVFGPEGVTNVGVSANPDPNDPENCTVSVENSVVGTVVLYVSYSRADGTLVIGRPVEVVSLPPTGVLNGIELVPKAISLPQGSTIDSELWLTYSNGTRVRAYVPSQAAISFVSSTNAIASVDPAGTVSFTTPGSANITVSYLGFSAQSSVTVLPSPLLFQDAQLGNVSTRLNVGAGDNVLIGGFIMTGTQPKKVIVRAMGPSLPIPGRLANPTLELHGPSGLIASNDDWQQSPNKQAIIDSTIPPTNALESAIVATLPANNTGYTAIVRGKDNGTGIGVVEAYDLDRSVDSKLANISTRGLVQTGDNVLIAGTIVLGEESQKVTVRAIGPSLTGLGVSGALQDPNLELRDGNGAVVAANDNWRSAQEAEIIATTIPPAHNLESAIVTTLPSNGASYTAIVRGLNDTSGIAVVEVYGLD